MDYYEGVPKATAFVQGHNLELYHGYASLWRGIQNMRSSCRFYRVKDVPTVFGRTPTCTCITFVTSAVA